MSESQARFDFCSCGHHGCVVGSNGFSRLHDTTREGAIGTLGDEEDHGYIRGPEVERVRQQILSSSIPTVVDVEKIGFERYWDLVSSCSKFPHGRSTFDQEMRYIIEGRV